MQVELKSQGEQARIGVAGPLLVVVFRGGSSVAGLDAVDREHAALVARYGKVSLLTVIADAPGGRLLVEDAVRARSVELNAKYDGQVRGSAIVVTSRGPGAVVARTFLSGFFLLTRSETPMKSFGSVREGLAWLQALPGQSMDVKTELSVLDIERFLG